MSVMTHLKETQLMWQILMGHYSLTACKLANCTQMHRNNIILTQYVDCMQVRLYVLQTNYMYT